MSALADAVIESGEAIAGAVREVGGGIADELRCIALCLEQLNETIHQAEIARQNDAAAARKARKSEAT